MIFTHQKKVIVVVYVIESLNGQSLLHLGHDVRAGALDDCGHGDSEVRDSRVGDV
jgi:hypothetical protein